jgi:hypothetical protein
MFFHEIYFAYLLTLMDRMRMQFWVIHKRERGMTLTENPFSGVKLKAKKKMILSICIHTWPLQHTVVMETIQTYILSFFVHSNIFFIH